MGTMGIIFLFSKFPFINTSDFYEFTKKKRKKGRGKKGKKERGEGREKERGGGEEGREKGRGGKRVPWFYYWEKPNQTKQASQKEIF